MIEDAPHDQAAMWASIPEDQSWYTFKVPVAVPSPPGGGASSWSHLEGGIKAWKAAMAGNLESFSKLSRAFGAEVPCSVCQSSGGCFEQHCGGNAHFQVMYAFADSKRGGAREESWQEILVPGGRIRFCHLDGEAQAMRCPLTEPFFQAQCPQELPEADAWCCISRPVCVSTIGPQGNSDTWPCLWSQRHWKEKMSPAVRNLFRILEANLGAASTSTLTCEKCQHKQGITPEHLLGPSHFQKVARQAQAQSTVDPNAFWQSWELPGGSFAFNHVNGQMRMMRQHAGYNVPPMRALPPPPPQLDRGSRAGPATQTVATGMPKTPPMPPPDRLFMKPMPPHGQPSAWASASVSTGAQDSAGGSNGDASSVGSVGSSAGSPTTCDVCGAAPQHGSLSFLLWHRYSCRCDMLMVTTGSTLSCCSPAPNCAVLPARIAASTGSLAEVFATSGCIPLAPRRPARALEQRLGEAARRVSVPESASSLTCQICGGMPMTEGVHRHISCNPQHMQEVDRYFGDTATAAPWLQVWHDIQFNHLTMEITDVASPSQPCIPATVAASGPAEGAPPAPTTTEMAPRATEPTYRAPQLPNPPAPPTVPDGWDRYVDEGGRTWFHHASTGEWHYA